MDSKEAKMKKILKERGVDVNTDSDFVSEDIPDAHPDCKDLMGIYYSVKTTIDMEFPYWYNRSWFDNIGEITEIRRGKALGCALAHLTPTILPQERLVMQKTKNMRGSFATPWITETFFVNEAEALMNEVEKPATNTADAVSTVGRGGGNVTESYGNVVSIARKFGIRKEEVPVLIKASKYWEGSSVEDLSMRLTALGPDAQQYFDAMDSVTCMFDSFTLPQGREVVNYYYALEYGLDGLLELCCKKAEETLGDAGTDGLLGMGRAYFYIACQYVIKGMIKWCENYAKQADFLASIEQDPDQKAEYEKIREVMTNIAHKKPSSFREALQLSLVVHLGVLNEDPISGLSIGRLGQILQPFYEKDIREGITDREAVIELLEFYRIKITCIECFASTGVSGGVLSGNTFNNLSLGGLNKEGLSAVTELEYLIIEAAMRNKTPQPTLSVLYDERNPEEFMIKCAECIKLGIGFPAFMSNQGAMNHMLRHYGTESGEGLELVEARAWAVGGCLETPPGVWQPLHYDDKTTWVPGGATPTAGSGVHFIALPKVLEYVLTDGVDERTGKRVLPAHGRKLDSFEAITDQWEIYMKTLIGAVLKANNIQMDVWRKHNMPIVNSLFKPDCLTKGQHIGTMGTRYNATFNFESCGTVNFVNSLASIKKNVFDDKKYTLEELKDGILHNFGYKTAYETNVFSPDFKEETTDAGKYARLFADCIKAPKYGNADEYVDVLLYAYEKRITDIVKEYRSYYGMPLYMCQISVSTHGPQGAITLASADGRLAGTTYGDASMSAAPATDKNGVYALFKSACGYDHSLCQNSQMNLKLHPNAVAGKKGSRHLLELIRSYMRQGGYHIQFNIVDSKVLREAQAAPENYRDLLVRVAGFTQYWCEIGKPIQDEVIFRTEYEAA